MRSARCGPGRISGRRGGARLPRAAQGQRPGGVGGEGRGRRRAPDQQGDAGDEGGDDRRRDRSGARRGGAGRGRPRPRPGRRSSPAGWASETARRAGRTEDTPAASRAPSGIHTKAISMRPSRPTRRHPVSARDRAVERRGGRRGGHGRTVIRKPRPGTQPTVRPTAPSRARSDGDARVEGATGPLGPSPGGPAQRLAAVHPARCADQHRRPGDARPPGAAPRRPAKASTPSSSRVTSPTARRAGLEAAQRQAVQPGEQVPLVGGGPDHVLQGVDRRRGHHPRVEDEEAGTTLLAQVLEEGGVGRPPQDLRRPPAHLAIGPHVEHEVNLGRPERRERAGPVTCPCRSPDAHLTWPGPEPRPGAGRPEVLGWSRGAGPGPDPWPGAGRPRAGARGRPGDRRGIRRPRTPDPGSGCGRGPGRRCPGRPRR